MPLTNVLVELAVLRQLREPGGQLHGQAAHRRLAQHLQSAAVGGDVQARGRALVHLGKNVLGNLRVGGVSGVGGLVRLSARMAWPGGSGFVDSP